MIFLLLEKNREGIKKIPPLKRGGGGEPPATKKPQKFLGLYVFFGSSVGFAPDMDCEEGWHRGIARWTGENAVGRRGIADGSAHGGRNLGSMGTPTTGSR